MTAQQENNDDSHTEALNNAGIYVFMDEVTHETMKPIIEWILYENYVSKKKKSELLLMICSPGGDLEAAFALIDVMHSSLISIKTLGLGQIGSSGLLIFMAGTKGRRTLTPNTSILSHQFSWFTEGKAHELFATMRELELTQMRMIEHYRKCTDATDQTIKEYFLPAQDRWLSAEEALNLKICDIVTMPDKVITQSIQTRKVK